jgi:hypothetical protein
VGGPLPAIFRAFDPAKIVPKSCTLEPLRPKKGKGSAAGKLTDPDIAWIEGLTKGSPRSIKDQIDMGWTEETRSKRLTTVTTKAEKMILDCSKTGMRNIGKLKSPVDKGLAAFTFGLRMAEMVKQRDEILAEQQQGGEGEAVANRKKFMRSMRCWLGDDAATKAHFLSIDKAAVPGTVILHGVAVRRIEQVRAELQDQGLDMPSTTVGQALRGRHASTERSGMMGHPFGLSLDYRAVENPRITDERVAKLMAMKGGATHVQLTRPGGTGELGYKERRKMIAERAKVRSLAMGMAPELLRPGVAAVLDADQQTAEFFRQFEQQFEQVRVASKAFRESALTGDHRKKLDEAKALYLQDVGSQVTPEFEKLEKLNEKLKEERGRARGRVGKKMGIKGEALSLEMVDTDPAVKKILDERVPIQEKIDELGKTVQEKLPEVFKPWLDEIAAELTVLRDAPQKAGVVLDEVPDAALLSEAAAKLKVIQAREAKIRDPAKRAGDATVVKLWGQVDPLLEVVDRAVVTPLPDDKKRDAATRLERVQALQPWPGKAHDLNVLKWLDSSLRKDLNFVFGLTEAISQKKAKTLPPDAPKFQLQAEVSAVPVAQLLEKGYFNPDDPSVKAGFNLTFFKTMIKYGFDPGAAWSPTSTDPMHFDFAEGWDALKSKSCGPGPA